MGRPEIPFLEEAGRRLGGWLLVEVLERQPYLVGARGLEVTGQETVECRPLPVGQIGWVA
jgi:hypothetical protein